MVEGSVRVRKAWWARFAVLPSCVVRMILRVSIEVKGTVFARGNEVDSLFTGSECGSVGLEGDALLFNATPDSAALSLDGEGCV